MGIAITHNVDGTVTVTCGSENLTFFPNGDGGGVSALGPGAGGGGGGGGGGTGSGGSGASGASTGAAAGGSDQIIPITPPPPGRRKSRLDGVWPLPGSMGFVSGRTLSRSNPPLSVHFEPTTGTWSAGSSFSSRVQAVRRGLSYARTEPLQIAIVTDVGQTVDLARIRDSMPDFESLLGGPVVFILASPLGNSFLP